MVTRFAKHDRNAGLIIGSVSLSIIGLAVNRVIHALKGRKIPNMRRDDRYSENDGWTCAPADTGTARATVGQYPVVEDDSTCLQVGKMTIQQARKQALADMERAEEARRAYATANAQQWSDYKVD